MAVVSGLAGVIQQQDQPLDLSGLAQTIMQMKKMKKEQAVSNLQTTLQLAQQGLVEPQALEKAVKDWEKVSGIKLSESAAAGGPTASMSPEQGKAMQTASQAGQQPSGAQSSTPVGVQTAKEHPAGGMQPSAPSGNIYENYINQVRRLGAAKGLKEEQTAKMEATLAQLNDAAMQGDENARGMLQATGHLAFDAEFERIRSLKKEDPKAYAAEMAATHDRALGLESPQQKEQRKSQFVTNLVASGDYSAEEAAKEFDKPGSSGVKKTISQLGKEADVYHKLAVDFGDETAAKVAPQLAAGASLNDVLPKVGKYQSQFAEQMAETKRANTAQIDLQKGQLQLQRDRLTFDKEMGEEKFSNLLSKIELEMAKAENEDFSKNLSDMISAQKAGIDIPEDVLNAYIDKLAKKVGLSKNEAKGWWNWMTPSYVPDVSKADSILNDFAPSLSRTKAAHGKDTGIMDIAGELPNQSFAMQSLAGVVNPAKNRYLAPIAKAGDMMNAGLKEGLSKFMQVLGSADVPVEGKKK